jgi:hypothetical protein
MAAGLCRRNQKPRTFPMSNNTHHLSAEEQRLIDDLERLSGRPMTPQQNQPRYPAGARHRRYRLIKQRQVKP